MNKNIAYLFSAILLLVFCNKFISDFWGSQRNSVLSGIN